MFRFFVFDFSLELKMLLTNCLSCGVKGSPSGVEELRPLRVASILSVVLGILALVGGGGLVASCLFGVELGIFTSLLVLCVTLSLGLLFLFVGLNCLVCRSLVLKSRSVPVLCDQEVLSLERLVSENRASAEAAEREVSSELEKLLNTQRRYEDLLRSREGEREYFLQAREKLLEAQNRVKSWGSQEESWGSQGKGLSKVTSLFSKGTQSPLPVLESRLSEFLSAVDSWDGFVKQLGGSLPKVDGLRSALKKLSEYTQKYLESSKRLCGYLKRQVVADQDKIKNLQEKIVDLESQLSDLRIDKTTKEETIAVLQKQLEDLKKARKDLEEAQAKRLSEVVKQKEEVVAYLTKSLSKLQQEKAEGELQKALTQTQQQLMQEQEEVAKLRESLSAEEAKVRVSAQEQQSLREQLDKVSADLSALSNKLAGYDSLALQKTNLESSLQAEKRALELEKTRREQLMRQYESFKESKDTELSLQAQKLGELQTQLNASKEDNGKLRRTLELYERLLRNFESKLEKKKHKDLEDFRTAKERLTSYQVYTREQILQGADQELFDKLESQRRELETRAAQLRDLSLSNDALQARVRNLESQVGNMTQALRTQQEQLSEKESKIAELQEKLLEESKKSSSANALVQAMTMSMSAEGRQRVLAITSPGTPSTETKSEEEDEID
ncbi:hypothetical protein [Chlamydia gallinacea]|uniref:hypothetical protein n=1 Tax=Chlamydia gallinacea TaxID=1457153 RepID=UPI0024E25EB7|nr:hypothetical protein [Chlamydia gallinacea]